MSEGRRTWQDTGITVHRSSAHKTTWAANIPTSEIMQIIDSAGPVTVCKRWVERNAPYYGYDLGDRTRWLRDDDNTWRLEARQLDEPDGGTEGQGRG